MEASTVMQTAFPRRGFIGALLCAACASQTAPEPSTPAPAASPKPAAQITTPKPTVVQAAPRRVRRVLPPVVPLTSDDLEIFRADLPGHRRPPRAVAWTMDVWTTSSSDPEGRRERFRGVLELDEEGAPAILNAIDDEYHALPKLSCDDGGLQRRVAANPSTGVPYGVKMPAIGRKVCAGQDAGQSRDSIARSEETRVRRPLVLDGKWEKGGQIHDEDAVVTYFEDRVLLSRNPDVWGVRTGKLLDAGDPRAPDLGPNPVELDIGWLRHKTGSIEWNVEHVDGKAYRVDFEDQGTITAEKSQLTSWTERNALRYPLRSFVIGTRHPLNKPKETYRAVTELVYVPFSVATSDPTRTVIDAWKAEQQAASRAGSLDAQRLGATVTALLDRGLVPASDAQLALVSRLRAKGDAATAQRLAHRAKKAAPSSIAAALTHAELAIGEGQCSKVRDRLAAMSRRVDQEPRRVARLATLLTDCGALSDAARLLDASGHVDYARYGYSAQDLAELALLRGRVELRRGDPAQACAALTRAAEQLPEQETLIADLMTKGNCAR